ncbi:MAG: hypothetical protein ABIY51_12105 [Ferruginibacter sp.]
MKLIISLFMISLVACCSSKQASSNDIVVMNGNTGEAYPTAPSCIKDLVRKFASEPKENPPRKVFQYNYRGNVVYYVTAICCDQYSDLFDGNCNLLGHPDGGITGKGDGKLPDFNKEKTGETLVWEDKR